MGSKKIPDKWMEYKAIGSKITGTRFIAFKTPLKKEICMKMAPLERFTPHILMERCPSLKLVIDLTNTNRYYNKQDMIDNGVQHEKILCPGQVIPRENLIYRFFDIVDNFCERNGMNDGLIGIHCTHGVNRTAYFIGRYMIERLGFPFDEAVSCIQEARGHNIERMNYVRDLEGKTMSLPRNPLTGKKHLSYKTMKGREDGGPDGKEPYKEGPKENKSRFKEDVKGSQVRKQSGEAKVRRGVEGGGSDRRARSPFRKVGGLEPVSFNRGRQQSPRKTGVENILRAHHQGNGFNRGRQESPRKIGDNLLRGHHPEVGFSGERKDPTLDFRYERSRSPRRRMSPPPSINHFQPVQSGHLSFHHSGNGVWEKGMDSMDKLHPLAPNSYRPTLEPSPSQWPSTNPFVHPPRIPHSTSVAPWRVPDHLTHSGSQSIHPPFQGQHFHLQDQRPPFQEHRPPPPDHRYPPFRSPDHHQMSPERLRLQPERRDLPRDHRVQDFFPSLLDRHQPPPQDHHRPSLQDHHRPPLQDHHRPPLQDYHRPPLQDHHRPPPQTFHRPLVDRHPSPPMGTRQHFMEPRYRSPGSPYREPHRRMSPPSDHTHFKSNSPIRQRPFSNKDSPLRDNYRPRERSPLSRNSYEDRFRNGRGPKPFLPHEFDEKKEDKQFGKFHRRPSPEGGFRSVDERWRGTGPPGSHKEVRRDRTSQKSDPIYERGRRSRSPPKKELLENQERQRRSSPEDRPIYKTQSPETSSLVYHPSSPVRPSSDDCRDLLNMKRSMMDAKAGSRNQKLMSSREKPLLTVKDLPKEVDLRNLLQADQQREANLRKKQPPVWNRLGRSPSPKSRQSSRPREKQRSSPGRKQKKF